MLSAADRATRENAEAAKSIGRNLEEWASNIGRSIKGVLIWGL